MEGWKEGMEYGRRAEWMEWNGMEWNGMNGWNGMEWNKL